jgi:hypothetical protein
MFGALTWLIRHDTSAQWARAVPTSAMRLHSCQMRATRSRLTRELQTNKQTNKYANKHTNKLSQGVAQLSTAPGSEGSNSHLSWCCSAIGHEVQLD